MTQVHRRVFVPGNKAKLLKTSPLGLCMLGRCPKRAASFPKEICRFPRCPSFCPNQQWLWSVCDHFGLNTFTFCEEWQTRRPSGLSALAPLLSKQMFWVQAFRRSAVVHQRRLQSMLVGRAAREETARASSHTVQEPARPREPKRRRVTRPLAALVPSSFHLREVALRRHWLHKLE